jgi:hypothetical protein
MSTYKIISSDSHLNEPLEIYQRLPTPYRNRAPRLEILDGKRFIIVEGQPPRPLEAPNPLNEDDKKRYWRDESEGDLGRVFHRAGGTDVDLRLRDQELDGIGAEVIYPHGTFNCFTSPDPGFQLVGIPAPHCDLGYDLLHEHLPLIAAVDEVGIEDQRIHRHPGASHRTGHPAPLHHPLPVEILVARAPLGHQGRGVGGGLERVQDGPGARGQVGADRGKEPGDLGFRRQILEHPVGGDHQVKPPPQCEARDIPDRYGGLRGTDAGLKQPSPTALHHGWGHVDAVQKGDTGG